MNPSHTHRFVNGQTVRICGQEDLKGVIESIVFERGASEAKYEVSYWSNGQVNQIRVHEADLTVSDPNQNFAPGFNTNHKT